MDWCRYISASVGAIVLGVAVLGCHADTGEEFTNSGYDSEEYVYALFDLSEGRMPTPTDLLYDEQAGQLDVPAREGATDAQKQFARYLDGLDGWPTGSPIRIPVSGAVDDGSLEDNVYLVEADERQRLDVDSRYEDGTGDIVVEPRQPLLPGATYRVAVRGYNGGVAGEDGQQLVADSLFYLLRADDPLVEHPDAVPGASHEQRRETAEELTELQSELDPVFQTMAAEGLSRSRVAVGFEFTTGDEPAIQYDAAGGQVPMPNDVLVDPDDGSIDLPVGDEEMTDEERDMRQRLSTREGFAKSAALVVTSTHRFADDEPSPQAFRLFERDEDTDQFTEVDNLERGVFDDGSAVWLSPEPTLEPDTEYVYVITDEVQTPEGQAHRAEPLGAITRMSAELTDEDGESQLDVLSDEQARRLEPLRRRVDDLLRPLEIDEQFDRDRVAAAVPFRTAANAEALLERRANLYEEDVTTEVTDIDTTKPSGAAGLLLDDVETVVRGEMTVLDYIDPEERVAGEDAEPVERQVAFAMTFPEPDTTSIHEPVPVVLFGHGLLTSRELLYLIAGELASAGYAAFAVDLPHHGSRSYCMNEGNCRDGASCHDDGVCRHADGTRGELKEVELTDMLQFLAGTQYDDLLNYPTTTGRTFIDLDNLIGTADAFEQALLDLNQAVRVIRGDELQQAVLPDPGHTIGDEILYLGMSLGGILGAGLTAVEPEIEDFVLNVPGADLAQLIENSMVFEAPFEHGLEERGLERGSDDYFEFINAARWLLDPIDPLNLAQHAIEDPLDYIDPTTGEPIDDRDVRVLIQMAEDERVVPNVGTELLAERMGVELNSYDPALTDHAFLFDPTSLSGATRQAREDLIEFFDER